MKTCTKCTRELPLSEFYLEKSRNRHRSRCRSCESGRVRAWQDGPGREKHRANIRRFRETPHGAEYHERSLRATTARRRGYKSGTYASRYTLEEVAEKTNGFCWICGCAVDLGIKHPLPESPSVDHVISLTNGGIDEISNVLLAHLACNSRRGAGSIQSFRDAGTEPGEQDSEQDSHEAVQVEHLSGCDSQPESYEKA